MKQTKIQQLKRWLLRGNSITGLQALKRFGYYRLSDGILKLRREGFNVVTEMRKDGECEYAVYRIGAK